MTVYEIALLLVGVIIFVISFLLPEGSNEKDSEKEIAAKKEEVHRMVEQEIDSMKLRVNEATNDTVEYAVDKAERSLERVSNEKIMAVNEYAGTIMEEINKNHNEVMFLYDMLKDKQTDITNIVREADAKVKEIEAASHNAQSASETLLRGMSVATVSQKGLTNEQKAIFDDVVIPEVKPVVFKENSISSQAMEKSASTNSNKPKGIALAQSKIYAGLMGKDDNVDSTVPASEAIEVPVRREKVAIDILSGGAYKEGNIINVEVPAGKSVTAADFAALSGGATISAVVEAPVEKSTNNNDKILELSKSGMGIVDIARTLNLGVGEVKLVLELFR